jgi:glycosyltransferase involved in cell wall biosynthesis
MKISIIIPVYNTEQYIERCIQSILGQTLQDFEIIIVNDVTQDNSMAIIKKYAAEDSRFIIVENSQNMGQMWARREGYRRASGDYFVFCDSDDYLPKNALEVLYTAILTEKADIISGALQRVTSKRKGGTFKNRLSYGTDSIAVYKSLLDRELLHNLCGKIYNRKLFDNNDYETFAHQTNGEDAMLFYQIVANIKRIKVINDVVYYYIYNPKSSSLSQKTEIKFISVAFYINYIFNYLENIEGLSAFIIKYKIDMLLLMLKTKEYSKAVIYRHLIWSNLNSFRILSQYYSGPELLWNYLVMNSTIVDCFLSIKAGFLSIIRRILWR